MSKTVILIPSRMSASRLPGKPLLKIDGKSIIMHVYKKAVETNIGKVFVATEDQEIFDEVVNNGGKCILTRLNHKSGTDRVADAFQKLDLENIEYILNLQGDEPMINVEDVKKLNNIVCKKYLDMGTLASKIKRKEYLNDENIVKVKTSEDLEKKDISMAEKFFRKKVNIDNKYIYHHIGIYQYKVPILKKIVSYAQSINEIKYRLEQLRAMDNNININVIYANSSPIGVDTEKDYVEIKKLMEYKT